MIYRMLRCWLQVRCLTYKVAPKRDASMVHVEPLLELLDEAIEFVSGYSSVNFYCGHDTGEEFAAEIKELRDRVAKHDWSALAELVAIFAPTCAWDDGVGLKGSDMANRIMARLDKMRWSGLYDPLGAD